MIVTVQLRKLLLLLLLQTPFDTSNKNASSSNKNNHKLGRKVVQMEEWNGNGVVKNVTEHYFPAKKRKHIAMLEHTKGILKHWPKEKSTGPYCKSNLLDTIILWIYESIVVNSWYV